MSLDWNVTAVENSSEVCFEETENGQKLKVTTEALIWLTLAVGIGRITEKNWKEFYTRANCYERLYRPMIRKSDGSGEFTTAETVKAHIGLRTNVSDETKAKWLKRLTDNFWSDNLYQLRDN